MTTAGSPSAFSLRCRRVTTGSRPCSRSDRTVAGARDGRQGCSMRPGLVLDIATGTAGVALQLNSRTGCRVVGLDLTRGDAPEGQGAASKRQGRQDRSDWFSATPTVFLSRTRASTRFASLICSGTCRTRERRSGSWRESSRPGGVIASLEFMRPPSRFWHAWWVLYTRVVLPLGGLVTGGKAWFDVGRFLGPNISGHYERYPLDQTICYVAEGRDRRRRGIAS